MIMVEIFGSIVSVLSGFGVWQYIAGILHGSDWPKIHFFASDWLSRTSEPDYWQGAVRVQGVKARNQK